MEILTLPRGEGRERKKTFPWLFHYFLFPPQNCGHGSFLFRGFGNFASFPSTAYDWQKQLHARHNTRSEQRYRCRLPQGETKKQQKKYLPITNKRACPNAILLPFNVEEYARLTKNLWTVHYEVNTVNPCFLRWLPSFTLSKESLRLIVKPAISLVARPSCSPPNRKIRAFYDPRNLVYHRTAPSSTYDAVTCRFAARCNFSSRETWSLHDILQTVFFLLTAYRWIVQLFKLEKKNK